MMNGHEQYAALLDAYIDGALSEQDAARVREHLRECPDCQSYVSDALIMRELFPGLEETPVPEGFAESVLSSLPARKVLWRKQWKRIAAPLAACVALAFLIRGLSGGPTKGGMAATNAAESAEFDEAAPEFAELYGVASVLDADEAEAEAAVVASDGGGASQSAASDNGATPQSALDKSATPRSASDDGAASDSGATPRSASDNGAASDGGATPQSAAAKGAARNVPASDGKEETLSASGASYDGEASPETPSAAMQSDDDAMSPTPEPSDAQRRAMSDASEEQEASASGVDASEKQEASANGVDASEKQEASANGADASAQSETDAVAEKGAAETDAVAEKGAAETVGTAETEAAGKAVTEGVGKAERENVGKAETEGVGKAATESETETVTGEAATEEVFASNAITVSVWTLDAAAAPIMTRYPPDAVTQDGKWYVLTAAEFEKLCERFPDVEITSGPEIVDAASLPDGAPAVTSADAVYLFAPDAAPLESDVP